ncbi:hypothetical protein VTP01DRAFT_5324 [Rhizomucor pusillus]|uniref:uncharacterized protein n=1 Tax=Rhizomucor pusillus TaxID=4840 RepID=UPI00374274C2
MAGMEGVGFLIVATVAVLFLLTLGIMCNQRRFSLCVRIKHKTSPELDHSETRQYPTVECSHRNNTGFYRLTRPPSYQNNHDSSHQSIPAGFIVNMQQASSSDNAATVLPPPPPAYKDHYRDTLLHPPLANPETSN